MPVKNLVLKTVEHCTWWTRGEAFMLFRLGWIKFCVKIIVTRKC